MTEKELLDYALSHGCDVYSQTDRCYKLRLIGTTGTKNMSGLEKISDDRELNNTYVFNVCSCLGIPQPINDRYSQNIFHRFGLYWSRFFQSKTN